MKVVTVHTMQETDKRSITGFGIPGLVLMENAGRACVDTIITEFGVSGIKRAVIIAGKGNNGGDGYVIARLLGARGWDVSVFILAEREQITGDAAVNLSRLSPDLTVFCPLEGELNSLLTEKLIQADVIVDALLGTGLNSTLGGIYRKAVAMLNSSGRPVLAVDIPSGIHGDTGRVMGDAVQASITVTFAFAKLGHILYPGAGYCGRLIIADIGIPRELMESASGFDFLTAERVSPMLRRRDRQAHKGDFGHCLIIAGSTGKSGAAALCANSAVRSGSGLVTAAVPESLNSVMELKTTEAMTVPLPDSGQGRLAGSAMPVIETILPGKDAIALGPGLGCHPGTVLLVQTLVETLDLPMVIDADGLNALAEDITILRRRKSAVLVLTPHPGEMARLTGRSVPEVEEERITLAREFAGDFGVYLILKGARTIIAGPRGDVAINGSGNPGMASGGMGDVLTGIICSLLGQGYAPWDACCLGVFLHGYAADMVADEKGEIGISASDVKERLPYACKRLFNLLM